MLSVCVSGKIKISLIPLISFPWFTNKTNLRGNWGGCSPVGRVGRLPIRRLVVPWLLRSARGQDTDRGGK